MSKQDYTASTKGQSLLRFEILIAAVALLLFIGITLATITKFSTWHDESYSVTLIENNYRGIIERTGYDVHPPLYYLLLKTWSLLAGNSVLALRLFSVTAMVLALIITWRLFRRVYGARAGLIALFGMALGPFLIRYAQEMRMYALGALWTALATWLLWRLLVEQPTKTQRRWYGVGYIATIAAAFYTHYFLVFLLAAHVLFTLLTVYRLQPGRLTPKGLLTIIKRIPTELKAGFIVPVLLFLPWVPTVHQQFSKVQGAFWIGPIKVETITSTIINFFSFFQQWELVGWTAVYGIVILILAVVLAAKWARNVRGVSERTGVHLVGSLLIVPIALLALVSLPPFQPGYQDRYLAFYAPFLYGALGLAIAYVWKNGRYMTGQLLGGLAVVVILIGVVSVSLNGNNGGWRPWPHFTINKVAEHIQDIDPNAQIVSTSLWTFLDTHTVFRSTNTARLYAPDPVGKYGNYSAVYNRPELILTNLTEVSGHVWLIEESGKDALPVPFYWQVQDTFQSGYARATLYATQ